MMENRQKERKEFSKKTDVFDYECINVVGQDCITKI
jgi:hypothetical protein